MLMLSRNEAYQKEKEEINKARAVEDAYVAGDFYHEEVRCASFTSPVALEFGHLEARHLGPSQHSILRRW